jgi:hypothetical protein
MNMGEVIGEKAGGILGFTSGSNNSVIVSCYNGKSAIIGSDMENGCAGGIQGYANQTTNIYNCVNLRKH